MNINDAPAPSDPIADAEWDHYVDEVYRLLDDEVSELDSTLDIISECFHFEGAPLHPQRCARACEDAYLLNQI